MIPPREIIPIDYSKCYSASWEDGILRTLQPYRTGVYIEVGTWDWIALSNTYAFHELGWRGMLIEPAPDRAQIIRQHRPGDVVIQKAITNDGSKTVTLRIDPGAASSIDPTWHIRTDKTVEVEATDMKTLLDQYPLIRDHCDFISIDVEGWERQLISTIDFATFRPTVMCIEAVRWKPIRRVHGDWEGMLFNAGYKFLTHTFLNRFYVLAEATDVWERGKGLADE